MMINSYAFSDLPEDQRCVDAAKGEIVAHHMFGREASGIAKDVIKFRTVGIDLFKIGGGDKFVVAHHFQTQPCFDGATCAKAVAEMALERVHRNGAVKHRTGGLAFGEVAVVGCRAVAIDDIDIGG